MISRRLLLLAASGAGASVLASGRVRAAATPLWAVAYRPDGALLAAGGYREVRLWRLPELAPLPPLRGPGGPVRALAWSRDGRMLAAAGGLPGETGEALVWTVAADGTAPAPRSIAGHRDVVESVAFARNGELLVTAGLDEKAVVTELTTGKMLRPLADHTNRVTAVDVSPDGRFLLTASLDRTVKVWSAADFQPLANIDAGVGPIHALQFLPGTDQFAVGGEEGPVRIFRLVESRGNRQTGLNGVLVRAIGGSRSPVLALAANGRGALALASADRTLRLVEPNQGGPRHTLRDLPDVPYSAAFSPDGSRVAVAFRDGRVRFYVAAEGRPDGEVG